LIFVNKNIISLQEFIFRDKSLQKPSLKKLVLANLEGLNFQKFLWPVSAIHGGASLLTRLCGPTTLKVAQRPLHQAAISTGKPFA